jgi:hypothetical protein
MVPFTYDARSDASKAIASPSSDGRAARPNGKLAFMVFWISR